VNPWLETLSESDIFKLNNRTETLVMNQINGSEDELNFKFAIDRSSVTFPNFTTKLFSLYLFYIAVHDCC